MKIIVIGAGVIGTMHAWHAIERGHDVVHLDRDLEARSASVRNFGLLWVSGRSDGEELAAAQRSRDLWAQIGEHLPDIGFRANSSLTVALTDAELAVAKEAARRSDARERGFELLDPAQVREHNPSIRGDVTGALLCRRDGAVEPRLAQPALRAAMTQTGRYTFVGGREIVELEDGAALDDRGHRYAGDLVIYAPGAALSGLTRRYAHDLPVRRVYLQMFQTAPWSERLTTSVADADSFRYYPGFTGPALNRLNTEQPQSAVPSDNHMQLLMVQRLDGSLTIGDTHAYDEPFPFDVVDEPTDYLIDRVTEILGTPPPRIAGRWHGIYAQCLDPTELIHRESLFARTHLVTGPGGRGMTCAPAIAETTANLFAL